MQDVQRLWIPFLVFDNTEKNEATKGTEDTELTLTREGDFIGSEDDNVEEINIFEGKFNRITFSQSGNDSKWFLTKIIFQNRYVALETPPPSWQLPSLIIGTPP